MIGHSRWKQGSSVSLLNVNGVGRNHMLSGFLFMFSLHLTLCIITPRQVIQWISRHGWTVGELWHMVVEYSSQRLKGETHEGFLTWLLPKDGADSDVDYMCE